MIWRRSSYRTRSTLTFGQPRGPRSWMPVRFGRLSRMGTVAPPLTSGRMSAAATSGARAARGSAGGARLVVHAIRNVIHCLSEPWFTQQQPQLPPPQQPSLAGEQLVRHRHARGRGHTALPDHRPHRGSGARPRHRLRCVGPRELVQQDIAARSAVTDMPRDPGVVDDVPLRRHAADRREHRAVPRPGPAVRRGGRVQQRLARFLPRALRRRSIRAIAAEME